MNTTIPSAERILVIGANGQIGSELVEALAASHGADNVFAADISPTNLYNAARYLTLNVLDKEALAALVTGFFYPVVPMGQARVRVQLSAAHSREQLVTVLAAFEQAGHELGLLNTTTN